MRILTTGCAALLIAALSTAYGLEEHTDAIERDIAELERRRDALRRELDVLGYEWRAATSPDRLERLASAAFGSDGPRDADGAPLAPWSTDQLLRLERRQPLPPERLAPEEERRGAISTSRLGAAMAGESVDTAVEEDPQ